MARKGLNCTLSYPRQGSRVYRVRCSNLTYGFEQVAEESEARMTRAFYPHRTAPTQFTITVDLIGRAEKNSFNRYLTRYAEYLLDPSRRGRLPLMTVTVPSRNFKRTGVPIKGINFGIRVGEMMWQPQVTFENSGEPLDWKDASLVASALADEVSPESQYFYPTGIQLSADDGPSGLDGFTSGVNDNDYAGRGFERDFGDGAED